VVYFVDAYYDVMYWLFLLKWSVPPQAMAFYLHFIYGVYPDQSENIGHNLIDRPCTVVISFAFSTHIWSL